MTAPPPESTVTFPWAAFVRDIVAAAVIALVIGALCYHFLAHQSWGEAFGSSLLWASVAIFGAAIGHAFAHLSRAKNARSAGPRS